MVFTVDQAYRITSNRLSLRTPSTTSVASAPIEVYCECSADHCTAVIVVPRGDYERLRPDRRQLLVAVGHEIDSPVQVTLRAKTYELVEPWAF